jgi:hypothetical protein
LILTLVFEKNANFFAENWPKSQKIVIITSTPGRNRVRRVSKTVKLQKNCNGQIFLFAVLT